MALALHRPASVAEASRLLTDLGVRAHVYAGGTELLLVLRLGLVEADALVDIKRIPGLSAIEWDARASELRIGAAATHSDLELSPAVCERCPALAALEADVANVRVRNAGTLGGNLCFAEPHADPPILLHALRARVRLESASGFRELPLEVFQLGLLEVDLRNGELLTQVLVPVDERAGVAYKRFAHLERPTAGVAAVVRRRGATAEEVRVVAGAVAARPQRLATAERAVLDQGPDGFEAAATAAAAEVEAGDDQYGPAAYKRRLVGTLTSRVLKRAWELATG
jgi:carbon-monoxide dehydrogenase medium subunit